MIYDCFSFFNELDLLEIRLNTLDKVVDKFILVESTLTHTGNPKPLYYAQNKDRFAHFNDRIIHIVVDDFPTFADTPPREMAWIRENWQRNAIVRGIPADAQDNDYLIISDLDEIPSPKAVKIATTYNGISHLHLKFYSYFLNYRNYFTPIWTGGGQILPLGIIRHSKAPFDTELNLLVDRRVNCGMTPTLVRHLKPRHTIKNAGWHFSFCGGTEAIRAKMNAYAHTEINTPENTSSQNIEHKVHSGMAPYNNPDRFFAVRLGKSFPKYICDNTDRLSHLIYPITPLYIAKSSIPKIIVVMKRYGTILLRPILPRKIKDWLYHRFLENCN
ncbi:MAG: hypothetical protein IJG18_03410 [Kiritimatiellae bacterium]|nr:hypothetical protein [Kiritimatiellia bacterium]